MSDWNSWNDATPKRPVKRATKAPSVATMERWMSTGKAKTPCGCTVEPDGRCTHGRDSWILILGLI